MKDPRAPAAAVLFAAIMPAFAFAFRRSGLALPPTISFTRTLAAFALLLAPLWFFGFGLAGRLRRFSVQTQIVCAGLLGLPYFVLTLGTPDFYWRAAIMVVAFPVLLAAFLAIEKSHGQMTWRDAAALAIITAAYFLKWLHSAWPYPVFAIFPKLFLADVALYCFLVVKKLDAGYSLVPTRPALWVGIREFLFYFPFAFGIGELTGFIHLRSIVPDWPRVVAALLPTFLLIAIPEELFFRGILQNLLESRMGRLGALILASLLFGLSHFNHGSAFNWRYVLLASIAGIFYGRAWLTQRQIFSALVTHTMVDVVWSVWFR